MASALKIELFFYITDLKLTLTRQKTATINNVKPLKFNLSKKIFSPINNKKRHLIRFILTQINSWLKPKTNRLHVNQTKIQKYHPTLKKNLNNKVLIVITHFALCDFL